MVGKEEEGRRKKAQKKPLRRDQDLNPQTLSPEPSVLSIRPRRPAIFKVLMGNLQRLRTKNFWVLVYSLSLKQRLRPLVYCAQPYSINFGFSESHKKSDDHELTFTDKTGWRISKKVGIVVATAFVVTCVAVGLIVFYAGVANVVCANVDDAPSASGVEGASQKPDVTHKQTVKA